MRTAPTGSLPACAVGWGQAFRKDWMGVVGTGITIAGFTAVWHAVFGFLSTHGRPSTSDTTGSHIRSAA